MNLVIVESPSKAKTIQKYLAQDFKVAASLGHIKDLPQKMLGVDIRNNFAPYYVPVAGKKKVIENLRKAAETADQIYIATDPDREGEAIAAHVAEIVAARHPAPHRVLFHEITRSAVQRAIKSPGKIDQRKVDAQIARRVVDRLVGYQVSPLIWKTVAKGLSAGRVQSVTLRLICEREQEVRDFVPQEYWSIHGLFSGQNVASFWANLVSIDGSKIDLKDEKSAAEIADRACNAAYQISSFKKSTLRSRPPAPYTTSTLQQDAARKLKFSPRKTMVLAQTLYEGVELPDGESVGLITYMRTDSTRIAAEAQTGARNYIKASFGDDYLPPNPRKYAQKKRTQDAHEAIRPTDVTRTPDDLKGVIDASLWKLYQIIWRRLLASQMADAVYDVTTVEIEGQGLIFRARGQERVFDGYQKICPAEDEKSETLPLLPKEFGPGYPIKLENLESKQHFTQPPPRYTEATLIKALDELGIGRPSTYATIVSTLFERAYVRRDDRKLLPSPLGETVNKILVGLFPDIFEVGFTARMEEQLDLVEEGTSWVQVVRDFYQPFSRDLAAAEGKRRHIKRSVQEVSSQLCEKCGSPMVVKWSIRGQFLACSAFPKCKNTKPLIAPQATGKSCPECGAELVVKAGRYGRFMGCSNYPKCKHIESLGTGVKCPMPDCGGELVERQSSRGRFYSCSNYPQCKFRTRGKPEPIACPECGYPFMLITERGEDEGKLTCPECKAVSQAKTEAVVVENNEG